MKKTVVFLSLVILMFTSVLAGCTPSIAEPTATVTPSVTPTVTITVTPTVTITPTLQPTPTEQVFESGYTQESPVDGMVLIYVPAGDFLMGQNGIETFEPQITVYLDAYWIDQTEVTNSMYLKCVESGACTPPHKLGYGSNSEYFGLEYYADYPVMNVDRDQAQSYCAWAGRSLPTEAQWEKAARGTDGRTYPWGEIITPDYANYGRSYDGPTPVGSYHSGISPYGAFDMAGNVWEWVSDFYDADYYQKSPLINPLGPSDGTDVIVRGGGSSYVGQNQNTYFRKHFSPTDRFEIYDSPRAAIGFRCAMDAK